MSDRTMLERLGTPFPAYNQLSYEEKLAMARDKATRSAEQLHTQAGLALTKSNLPVVPGSASAATQPGAAPTDQAAAATAGTNKPLMPVRDVPMPTTAAGFADRFGDMAMVHDLDDGPPAPMPARTPQQQANYEDYLSRMQPRSIAGPGFTRVAKQKGPMSDVPLPVLTGRVGLNDLMAYRMKLLGAGTQMLPKIANAAQDKRLHEQAKDAASLQLEQMKLGQGRQIAQAQAQDKMLDRETRLEAARIGAAGKEGGMDKAMKNIEGEERFMNMMPQGSPNSAGLTPGASAMQFYKAGFDPTDILAVSRMIQDEATAQHGGFDLKSVESADLFADRMRMELAKRNPELMAKLQAQHQ